MRKHPFLIILLLTQIFLVSPFVSNAQVRLFKDIYTEADENFVNEIFPAPEGMDRFFFEVVNNASQTTELWVTDGTDEGTQKVISFVSLGIASSPYENDFAYANGYFFFWAKESNTAPLKLYRTDGTDEGTVYLSDLSGSERLVVANGKVYYNGTTTQLYETDGVTSTPIHPEEIQSYTNLQGMVALRGKLYFSGYDTENPSRGTGYDLFEYDGSTTKKVMDSWTDSVSVFNRNPEGMAAIESSKGESFDKILFYGVRTFSNNEYENGIYALNPATGDIETVHSNDDGVIYSNDNQMMELNGRVYFQAPDSKYTGEEWQSDIPKSTILMSMNEDVSSLTNHYEFKHSEENYGASFRLDLDGTANQKLFGTAYIGALATFFSLDSASGEVTLLTEISTDYREYTRYFRPQSQSELAYFSIARSDTINGDKLWRTDGTKENTLPFSNEGPQNEDYGMTGRGMTMINDMVYIIARGDHNTGYSNGLWMVEDNAEIGAGGDEGNGDSYIFSEYFTDAVPPSDWATVVNNEVDTWELYEEENPYAVIYPSEQDQDEWLISPEIAMQGHEFAKLTFYNAYLPESLDNAQLSLHLKVEDGQWSKIWEAEKDGKELVWRYQEIDLSEYVGKEYIQLGWRYFGSGGETAAVDDIILKDEETEQTTTSPSVVNVDFVHTFGEPSASQDYRLIALPGQVDKSLASLLGGSQGVNWQVFWDDGSDEDYLVKYDGSQIFSMAPGNGFWVTSTDSIVYSDTLTTVELNEQNQVSIPLHEGWNIISNPLDIDVSWSAVASINGDSLQPVWGFDGVFEEMTDFISAKTGQAFYFLNDQGLEELIIPYQESSSAKGKDKSETQQLTLTTLVDGNQTSSSRIVFVDRKTKSHVDVVAPPSGFEGPALRFTAKKSGLKRSNTLARIYRVPDLQGQKFDLQLNATPGQPMTIKLNGWDHSISAEAVLIDQITGKSYDLTSPDGIRFTPEKETTPFSFVLGGSPYLKSEEDQFLPRQIDVLPNYPNPFNPSTTIRFALPEQAEVRVQIYDILGRRVNTLINGVREAGIHTVTFDASRQASGMYFAIFEIGSKRFTQKMLLVK